MQALIDFDGWRKWKDFSSLQASSSAKDSATKNVGAGAKTANGKLAVGGVGGGKREREREREREKRGSVNSVGVGGEGVEGKVGITAGA